MPDETLDVEISGERELEQGLGRMAAEVADGRKPLQKAGEILAESARKRFDEGGTEDGPWAAVKPETRKRRKGDKSAPPLTDTGDLKRAATATRAGVRGAIYELTPDGLTKGVEGPSVRALQQGREETNLPSRPFLLATESDERAIVGVFDRQLGELADDF